MAVKNGLISELQHESANTRKMLERIPADKYTWKPHAKSKELLKLAGHIAMTPIWIGRVVGATEFDFSKHTSPAPAYHTINDVLALHDTNVADAIKTLEGTTDEALMAPYTVRNGQAVLFTMPRVAVIRSFSLSHIIHHRGQLSVYLRLLDVPVPGMYGPSADDAK